MAMHIRCSTRPHVSMCAFSCVASSDSSSHFRKSVADSDIDSNSPFGHALGTTVSLSADPLHPFSVQVQHHMIRLGHHK